MDQEIRELLEETHALAKDNNRMLRAIRRSQWLSFLFKLAIVAIVLLVPLYVYQHYLQPLLGNLPSGAFGISSSADLQKLLDSYKSGQ